MSLYRIGIVCLGGYVNPSEYLEDVEFIIDEYVKNESNVKLGDYPTLRYIGSSEYGIDLKGELGLISMTEPNNLSKSEAIALNNIPVEEFEDYIDTVLSSIHLRTKCKGDFIGLYDKATVMEFTSPKWEGLDITVVFNYVFKRIELPKNFDLLIIVDNPPKTMSNTETIIKSLLEKSVGESYLYTNKGDKLPVSITGNKSLTVESLD